MRISFLKKVLACMLISTVLGCTQNPSSPDVTGEPKSDYRREEISEEIAGSIIEIKNKIDENWIRPPSTRNGMLVKLNLSFHSDGSINTVKILESSGSEEFDISALEAVERSAPFNVIQELTKSDFEKYFASIDFHFLAVENQ